MNISQLQENNKKKKAISVEDYSKQYTRKIIANDSPLTDDDLDYAGKCVFWFLKSLAREGEREDVRSFFKIFKDEFGNEWKICNLKRRQEITRRLFAILDCVHEECQLSLVDLKQGQHF